MATLTQLTLAADGTIGANTLHDAGTGTPFVGHCNDLAADVSADWVANDQLETTTTAYFTLTNVDADFGNMDTLNIDVDVDAIDDGSSDDTLSLTAQIFDAEGGNALSSSHEIGSHADTTRLRRNVVFTAGSLTGNKTQWDSAVILFTWTYVKNAAPDNVQVRLYGCDIDGTYTASAGGLSIPVAMATYARMRSG